MIRRSHYRSLFYFDAVWRHGSVREAARHLGIAASAINRQILNFEHELGVPLFERLPNGMTLTSAGEIVARHAIVVLQDEKRATSELEALQGLERGEITLVAAESANSNVLPTVIGQMLTRYPGIQVKVRTVGSNSVPGALIAGDADIGVAFSLPLNRDIQQLAVARFRLGAVMRPDHPLLAEIQESQIAFASCSRFPLVLPSWDLSIHSLLEPQLRRFQDRMQVAAEVSSLDLMRQLTLRLGAVSFQSRVGLEGDLESGRLVHIPLFRPGPILTELGVYIRKGRSLAVAPAVLVGLLRDHLASLEDADKLS